MATSRIIAMRSAAVGSVCARRRMSRTSSRSCTATNGGACFTPTPTRRCSPCTNDGYPRTKGLDTGLPRFSTQSQSSNFPNGSTMAHFSFDACPLSRDAAAYFFLQCLLGRHCEPLSSPTPGQLAICTSFVPLPCESNQHNHSNTSTSVAVCQPRTLLVRARTNSSKLSAPGFCVVGRPCVLALLVLHGCAR